ncbi:Uncharacterised protein [Streptococcus pneumoniae]|nr:hypothetical protein [Streptococcus pneumoniae]MDS4413524.1 hypothetical protein [Streptococcus pneumoniae]MDS5318144.1 hypothetical protein [Streptococcus pneumoniae]MDS5517728.1 hypothetical protein [Streptococcus pneumoniae]MDS5521135.1 hypothetical protein [Streptococcus pneumoniae]
MKRAKIFTLIISLSILFSLVPARASAATDPYWENQKRLTKMVYGPFFAYRTGNDLNHWAAKIPGHFENKVRAAVIRKYGYINPKKTYRVRWYQKITPGGTYGMGQSGQAVGFYCEN